MPSLRTLLNDPHFRRGGRDMLEFGPGIAAWGLVTGVAMAKSGLTVPLAILMSLTVYAGSAQLASLPLLAAGAPMGVVWAAAFCVNLRFVIFSAQWRTHIGHLPRGRRLALAYLPIRQVKWFRKDLIDFKSQPDFQVSRRSLLS